MAGKEFEIIHSHNIQFSRSSWYVILLFVPPIIFALTIVLYLKFSSSIPVRQQTASSVEAKTETKTVEKKKVYFENAPALSVEIAKGEIERNKGLSNRKSIGDFEGMLFIFPETNIQPAFWMKEMNFAIDIIWIKDNKIAQIDSDVQPEPGVSVNKLKLYIPNDPIDYVLEVKAGFCEKYGIEAGNEIGLSEVL